MPVHRIARVTIAGLLRRRAIPAEDPATAALIRRLRHVKRAGAFTRAEFLAMCRWKSVRAVAHYRRNTAATVERVSRAALAARGERERMARLLALRGVSVPMASAILTLIDPRRYGVLDIRVWQLLWALGMVDTKPSGRGFHVEDWLRYLDTLRRHARALGVSARAVEWALFHCHRARQVGRLYELPRPRPIKKGQMRGGEGWGE